MAYTTQPVAQSTVQQPAPQQGAGASFAQPGYLGAPATINPSTYSASGYNATGIDPSLMSALDPTSTINYILQGFAPQAQSAENNLNQTLANFGINGGQAVGAATQLQAQLGGALAPTLASAIQNAQGNLLNAGEFNAGAQNTAGAFNAGAQNQSGQFNAGAANNANQYNAEATNTTNAANVGQYNKSQQQMMQDLLQQWALQYGAFNNVNQAGQGAQNNQAVQFGGEVTTSDPFGAIFGPLAQAGGQLGAASIAAGA